MRSFLTFGLPIEIDERRYLDILDDQSEQHEFITDFQRDVMAYTELYEEDPDIEVQIFGFDVTMSVMNDMIGQDQRWAGAAVVFVLVFFSISL
mmetsp:Transcript_35748/g.54735  ORF Transcript_35748/g.54735 Transcript_35748/m.54735 type:complete len:93 (-) Transcript_35748:1791-2069(-)